MAGGPEPSRDDVSPGQQCVVIHSEAETVYEARPMPLDGDDVGWVELREYEHDEMPSATMEGAEVVPRTVDSSLRTVEIYASDISGDRGQTGADSGRGGGGRGSGPRGGYVISFSDGTTVPQDSYTTHTTQAENMGEAVDYLVREYDLTDEIELPHLPPNAYQNCTINSKDEHPGGEEMVTSYELSDGNYLFTTLNEQSKRKRIQDLADYVGLEVEFHGGWNN